MYFSLVSHLQYAIACATCKFRILEQFLESTA